MRQTQPLYNLNDTAAERERQRIAQDAVEAERKRRIGKRVESVLYYALTLIGVFVSGWLFMLAVGIAHADWIPTLPTIRYGTACWLMVLLHGAWMFKTMAQDLSKTNR